jgi:hypothetical protein
MQDASWFIPSGELEDASLALMRTRRYQLFATARHKVNAFIAVGLIGID